jgi:hypothetical protein
MPMSPTEILNFEGFATIPAELIYDFYHFLNQQQDENNLPVCDQNIKKILGNNEQATLIAVSGQTSQEIIEKFNDAKRVYTATDAYSNFFIHTIINPKRAYHSLEFMIEFLDDVCFDEDSKSILSHSNADDVAIDPFKVIFIQPIEKTITGS